MSLVDAAASAFGRSQRRVERSPSGALHDQATGLVSTAAFLELAEERLGRCAATGGRCAILVVSTRDDTGAPISDHALRILAGATRSSISPPDLAGHDEEGDIVVLLDRCDHEDAKQVCSRILRALYAAGRDGVLAPSVGIAVTPDEGRKLSELLRHARKEARAPRRAAMAVSAAVA